MVGVLGHAENFRSETARRLNVPVKDRIKPRFHPDQPVSPEIVARQKIFHIREGSKRFVSRDARVVDGIFFAFEIAHYKP
jgi:hypothetical protein